MNFIKKKIKHHKKGHDKDDDFDVISCTQQSTQEGDGNGEKPQRDTEEWQFFQQLTERVQDTVQKSQTTLSKLKDSSAIADLNKPEFSDSEDEVKPLPPTVHTWVHFEDDSPFPDGGTVLSSAKSGKDFKPPPRPPPPKAKATTDSSQCLEVVDSGSEQHKSEPENKTLDFELLEEFGIQKDSQFTVLQTNLNSLLDIEAGVGDEGDDPFDTSFVDTATTLILEKSKIVLCDADSVKDSDKDETDPFDTSFVENLEYFRNNKEDLTRICTLDNQAEIIQHGASNELIIRSAASVTATAPIASSTCTDEVASNDFTEKEDILDEKSSVLSEGETMSNPFLPSSSPPSLVATDLFQLDSDEVKDVFGSTDQNVFSSTKTSTNPFQNGAAEDKGMKLFDDVFSSDLSSGFAESAAVSSTEACSNFLDPFGTTSEMPDPSAQDKSLNGFDLLGQEIDSAEKPEETFGFFSDKEVVPLEKKMEVSLKESVDPFEFSFEEKVEADTENVEHLMFSSQDNSLLGDALSDLPVVPSQEHSKDGEDIPEENKVDRKMSSTLNELNFFSENFDPVTDAQNVLSDKTEIIGTATNGNFTSSESSKQIFENIFSNETEISKSTSEIDPFISLVEDSHIIKDENSNQCSDKTQVINPFESNLSNEKTSAEVQFDLFGDFINDKTQPPSEENKNTSEFSEITASFKDFGLLDNQNEEKDTKEPLFSDPFDTSAVKIEPVKGSLPYTDTAAFEAFAAKFEQAIEKLDDSNVPLEVFDPFSTPLSTLSNQTGNKDLEGFGTVDAFDPFLAMTKPPENTPTKLPVQQLSQDSFDEDEMPDFSVVIKPKMKDKDEVPVASLGLPPILPPPPKTPPKSPGASKENPFDQEFYTAEDAVANGEFTLAESEVPVAIVKEEKVGEAEIKRTESQESPSTPLFDEDTSQPLEEFPKQFEGEGWDMMLRQPNKKKITGNRFWKKVYVKLSDNNVLQLFNKQEDNDPFQELPLQACYSLSEVGTQQYDAYGKIFTVKLQYIFYRERVGVRPGQISKVMHGQITSMGQIAKLGLPLEHAPQVSQLLKLGTQIYTDIKTFVQIVENALFHLTIHRDRALTYKTEEVQVTVYDEFYVEQNKDGFLEKQLARVRLFFLAFITGMSDVELGLNDLTRQGKEVVGRQDIIPVVTEEWIRLEDCEFHCCVMKEEFEKNRIIKFQPPDACLFELMRFRIRPPRNRELPLQVKANMTVVETRVEIRADVLVPGYHSRKHGQVPCENVQIRFPIPECWIYLFRVEKHFRYGSLKAAARKPGKIKGLERIIGTAQSLDPSLIEVSTGQAKYEHASKAVIWRIPRLPKEGQGAYTNHLFLLRLDLTSFDQIPESFSQYINVEFTMPATTVSHTTVRSVSVSNFNHPEKYVRYVAKHEYRVEIEAASSFTQSDYVAATAASASSAPPTSVPTTEIPIEAEEENDSD